MKERVYFSNHNFGPGEWGEVTRGEKWVRRGDFIRRRYLFRNGDKALVVFAPVPWALFKDGKEVPMYPGEPRSHFAVWDYLAEWDPSPLVSELDCQTDDEGRVVERPHGDDSPPIGMGAIAMETRRAIDSEAGVAAKP